MGAEASGTSSHPPVRGCTRIGAGQQKAGALRHVCHKPMPGRAARFSPLAPPITFGVLDRKLDRFDDLAGGLERAAAAIARLDTMLSGHPLAAAWLWRIRLEAVRRQAMADGLVIDPWHLAAAIEGVRFRMDRGVEMIDRGAIFAAARHALGLWRWFVNPDQAQLDAIQRAAATLSSTERPSPLVGTALGVHAWLEGGGERPAMRAALALHWQRRGLMRLACPLLTGAKALTGDTPGQLEPWAFHFLTAVAEEAEAAAELLRVLEREWFAARSAVRNRRRDSRAPAAVDIMAAAPVVSATSLAGSLGIAVKNAAALLEVFVARGIAIEVTHRSKRRLYGLKHLAPLRDEAAPPRRPMPGRGRGRPPHRAPEAVIAAEYSDAPRALPLAAYRPALSPIEQKEFDFTDLDRWMREADLAIRRAKAVLDQLTAAPAPAGPDDH